MGLCQSIKLDANDTVLSESDDGFDFGIKQLHRIISGILRSLQSKKTYYRVADEVPKGDQQ
jgi:hypothetical protein